MQPGAASATTSPMVVTRREPTRFRAFPTTPSDVGWDRGRLEVVTRIQTPSAKTPECGHALRPAVEDRLKDLLLAAASASARPETRCGEARRAAAVTAVAVHRREETLAHRRHLLVALVGIAWGPGRLGQHRIDVGRVLDRGRRCWLIRLRLGRRLGSHLRCRHEQSQDRQCRGQSLSRSHGSLRFGCYRPKIQTIPPWLVWRPISFMKSAGGRTSV